MNRPPAPLLVESLRFMRRPLLRQQPPRRLLAQALLLRDGELLLFKPCRPLLGGATLRRLAQLVHALLLPSGLVLPGDKPHVQCLFEALVVTCQEALFFLLALLAFGGLGLGADVAEFFLAPFAPLLVDFKLPPGFGLLHAMPRDQVLLLLALLQQPGLVVEALLTLFLKPAFLGVNLDRKTRVAALVVGIVGRRLPGKLLEVLLELLLLGQ